MSKLLDNLTIRSRVLAVVGSLLAVLVVVVAMATVSLRGTSRDVDALAEDITPSVMLLLNIDRDAYQAQLALERAVDPVSTEPTVEAAWASFDENSAQVAERWAQFAATSPEPGEAAIRQQFMPAYDAWIATAGELADATTMLERGSIGMTSDTRFEEMRAVIDDISSNIREPLVDTASHDVADQIDSLVTANLVLLVVGLAVGGVVAFFAVRSIVGGVRSAVAAIDRSSIGLSAVSSQVGASAEETAAQSGVVSSSAEEVSVSVSTVATAVEEMTSSIGEIAQNAAEATRVSQEAVDVAGSTNATVAELGDSSAQIGQVIEVITSIAEQTNLLALNATIEAARAGEAGKGFAVVANEVKDLAKQTADATEEIGSRIAAIQRDSGEAVTAIERIQEVIARVADLQTTIASAVEEQTATTNEISRNVTEAARGAGEIAENISGVAQAAQSTSEGAVATQQAADELQKVAGQLRKLVERQRPTDGPKSLRSPAPTAVPAFS
ncbi:methyl-accepting chemotaxis protein [Actinomarinicola tropica]|uniref:Methyl-accepting chemotaxis protein n=1 Tax=Actinomarinicola tropica TaxID=2789776 RepID=A0A5Q2RFM6_9ACTN|nr:methyl-accepting chemotaxis protein [Actinomarinicola tropica]QGG95628.1 methyl-accepting chemotaxis protein [Actinomarinicola tropica]